MEDREMTNTTKLADDHETDADCTLDATDTCIRCGVTHGDPCPDCGGRGYHALDCAAILAIAMAEEGIDGA